MRYFLCFAAVFLFPVVVAADTEFTTDFSQWQAMAPANDTFIFTSPNTGLADEVTSDPIGNAFIGPVLTFQGSNTGLDFDFQVQTLEVGAGFTWDDNEGDSDFNDALSVGDIDNFDDDDFRIDFTGTVTAFGFDLRDNDSSTGESFSVFGDSGLLGTFSMIPADTGSSFVGVVTDDGPISHVIFDEDSGSDDIAIRSISFSTNAIPEPGSGSMVSMAMLFALCFRRRTT